MSSVAASPNPPIRTRRHHVWLACLLFAAQLVLQLHVLQHLENLDHDEAENEVCLLCILGAATDHASIDSVTLEVGLSKQTQPVSVSSNGFTTPSLIVYRGRAPPSSSSIA